MLNKGKNLFLALFMAGCIYGCVWEDHHSIEESSDNESILSLDNTEYSNSVEESSNSESLLSLNDTKYPYTGVPRIVIETENQAQVQSRNTYLPAKLQIYGKNAPESEIQYLSIRARGNTSYTAMPKHSYKLKFNHKQTLFNMPKDKEWALIANFGDKTHLKNFITYKLADWLGDEYSPRAQHVELFLNREYLGLYLLTETPKIDKNRINIPEDNFSFLLEIGPTKKNGKTYFEQDDRLFEVCYPKDIDSTSLALVTKHISDWSQYLSNGKFHEEDSIDTWLDVDDFIRYYWIQEFTKNLDAAFHRSILFTWQKGDIIKMGPVWDFDQGYGNWNYKDWQGPDGWPIRSEGWPAKILLDAQIKDRADNYWKEHRDFFATITDSISKYGKQTEEYTKNDFKRWPILESTENEFHKEPYESYQEAIDSLNSWIVQRLQWMNDHL